MIAATLCAFLITIAAVALTAVLRRRQVSKAAAHQRLKEQLQAQCQQLRAANMKLMASCEILEGQTEKLTMDLHALVTQRLREHPEERVTLEHWQWHLSGAMAQIRMKRVGRQTALVSTATRAHANVV